MNGLIGSDILLMRKRYDEALKLRGIPAKYQYPIYPDTNVQGEPVIDSYSVEEDIHIFFESAPKAKTFKRFGWVVDNDKNLPFLIRCSFNLQNLQKDCLFHFSGLHSGLPDRVFRVTEIAYDLECPDHLVCQVVPVLDKQTVGRTDKEIDNTFNKSNTFLKKPVDYRGHVYDPENGGDNS